MELQAEDIDTGIGFSEPLWYLPLQFVRARDSPLHGVLLQFLEDGSTLVANQTTNAGGEATVNWTYPTAGVHTITVKVAEGQPTADCTIAKQPLTLTVGVGTRLLLWLSRDYTGTGHIIYGQLLTAKNSIPLPGRLVKLDINGTVYELATNQTGHIRIPKEFQPVNGTATIFQPQLWLSADSVISPSQLHRIQLKMAVEIFF